MISIIGSTIATFLCLLLMMKKGKSQSDFWLLLWLSVTALHQILVYGETSGLFFRFPHLLAVSFSFPLFHGILLFLYTKSMVSGRRLLVKEILPHLIPPLFLIALAVPFHSLSGEEKIAVFKSKGIGFEGYLLVRQVMMFVSGIGYVVWTLFLLKKHRASLENVFSNTEHKNLRWLEYLSIGLGIIWSLAFFFYDPITFAAVAGFVLFIGFYGIQQMTIFQSNSLLETALENTADIETNSKKSMPDESARYAKSGLKNEDVERIYSQLQTLMVEKFPYKNPELNLAELAQTLGIHPNHLSQVINEREQKNFYHYINTLRVEEFLRLSALPESRRFTLLALAFDCGFNSKTTFNKYFKHQTSKTPSDFFQTIN